MNKIVILIAIQPPPYSLPSSPYNLPLSKKHYWKSYHQQEKMKNKVNYSLFFTANEFLSDVIFLAWILFYNVCFIFLLCKSKRESREYKVFKYLKDN